MIEFIKHVFSGQNQFASGGLLLMVIGAVGAYLRSIPQKLLDWMVEQTTMLITVKDDDAAFVWIKEWFLDQKFLKRVRRIDLDTTLQSERVALIPAPGLHWFWYSGRPFQVWFTRSEETKERTSRRMESLTFRTIGRKQAFIRQFVDDVVRSHNKRRGVRSWLYTYNDGWDYSENYTPRLLESVVLQPGDKESLVDDIRRFRKSRQRYLRMGVPYHRGYLLYGPPGTGKTSLVSAVAAHFALSIYCVNLTEFNDRSLMAAVSQVPKDSVLLFEDIDCMRSGQKRESAAGADKQDGKREKEASNHGVTLSGLLNVLDGFFAPTGVLFMMTTNQVEALDPALLRPGRIDYKLYLGKASDAQKVDLYLRFFPDASEMEAREFVRTRGMSETMAEFQGLLLSLAADAAILYSGDRVVQGTEKTDELSVRV
jgi:chaperone BCS1